MSRIGVAFFNFLANCHFQCRAEPSWVILRNIALKIRYLDNIFNGTERKTKAHQSIRIILNNRYGGLTVMLEQPLLHTGGDAVLAHPVAMCQIFIFDVPLKERFH